MSISKNAVAVSGEFHAAQLFTPQQRIPMPGQDAGRCEKLFDDLCRHFQPRDAVEAMWVNDVAVIMAKIEFLRKCHRAATLVALRRQASDHSRYDPGIQSFEVEDLKAAVFDDEYSVGGDAGVCGSEENLPIVRLLGTVSMGSLRKEEDFMGLEFAALRERDRIIDQIGRKRRDDMKAAVAIIDAQLCENADG